MNDVIRLDMNDVIVVRLDPEKKRLWVEALRSGQFEQGRGMLHVNNKFCCLGVLCKLAANAGACESYTNPVGETKYQYEYSVLPTDVKRWVAPDTESDRELRSSVRVIVTPQMLETARANNVTWTTDPGELVSLTDLNDCFGFTFDQIADVIEEQL